MGEESRFVLQQVIEAAVQCVLGGHTGVRPQQIRHGAGIKPVAMQLPLAARGQQSMRHQYGQNLLPARALSACPQFFLPERVQMQLPPQLQRQPAPAPLPRTMQGQLRQPYLHHIRSRCLLWNAIFGKQRHLANCLLTMGVSRNRLNGALPLHALAVVDLPKIKDVTLDRRAALHSAALHNTPRPMLFSVLETAAAFQVHANLSYSDFLF